MAPLRVNVPVTTLWTSPNSPRPIDAPAVSDDPDPVGWLAALDAHPDDDETGHGRLGLHGRVDSQAMLGEPVLPTEPVDPAAPPTLRRRYTSYEMASRLSYTLWSTSRAPARRRPASRGTITPRRRQTRWTSPEQSRPSGDIPPHR